MACVKTDTKVGAKFKEMQMLVTWLSTCSPGVFLCVKFSKVLPFMMLQLLPKILQEGHHLGQTYFSSSEFPHPNHMFTHHCFVVSSLLLFLSLGSDSKAHCAQEPIQPCRHSS